MKKAFILLSLMLLSTFSAIAQEEQNPKVKFYHGIVEYKKPSTLMTLVGAAGPLSKVNPGIMTEDKTMVDGLKEAIQSAYTYIYRLNVQQGDVPTKTDDDCFVLNAILSNTMSSTGIYGSGARTDITFSLVSLKTGKEVAKQKYEVGVDDSYTTKAAAAEALNLNVVERTAKFLVACFPLTGSILQKGVQQLNGKVKEKQCYIDLGDKFLVYEDMPFKVYTEKNGKRSEIGTLKLKETEGDDIGVCTIKKGDSKIEKAMQNGEHLVIVSDEPLKQKFRF